MLFERTVENLSELVGNLSSDLAAVHEPVWYRGHSDKDWKLVPSIFRSSNLSEMNLIRQFKQNAILFAEPIPTKLHDWLFLMRHYYVPTRLLDWTESPLVGIYFATNEYDDKDGALWILLPLRLNKEGGREYDEPDHLPSFDENPFMNSYSPDKFEEEVVSSPLPIAFIAPRNSPRMQSQLSVFTINHRNKTPIEEIGDKNHIARYIIPKEAKIKIRKELELLRIDEFQLFPELQSIGRKLNRGQT